MSSSVLYDVPGPKAVARNRVLRSLSQDRIDPRLRTEKPAATVVFFSRAMNTLIIGGITERLA
jgi:hypothetical protein